MSSSARTERFEPGCGTAGCGTAAGGTKQNEGATRGRTVPVGLVAVVALTVLSLAPAILVMMTCFTRIVIVLHFLRQALGLQNVPPNQVLMGLALLLTWVSMGNVMGDIQDRAVAPYLSGSLSAGGALQAASRPLRAYMLKFTRAADIEILAQVSDEAAFTGPEDIPFSILLPAYVLGELRAAFIIGLALFLPFLVIDLVVAVVIAAAGLNQLSPVTLALPFKLMLFVMIDGWNLVVGSLVRSLAC